tara:strand:+ start:1977 stop:2306 length:330 start_codon:yes stop_codon:yes gene_type:complete
MPGSAWYVVLSVCTLTGVEVLGTSALSVWARTGSAVAAASGVGLFALLGWVLGVSIHVVSHVTTVNTVWQCMSIVGVALTSVLAFGETVTARQAFGVLLALCASACFVE